eukprot:symbB.v1.2.001421.t1/scaffold34.1/size402451/2
MPRCWPKTRHASYAAISRGGLIGRQQHLVGELLKMRYDYIDELGSGSFGKVNLVREKNTGLLRVIKTVDTAKLSQRLLDNMREEIQVLRALDHPNIIRLFEYGEDVENQKIHLLMERCSGGDLDELLERAGHFGEELVALLMRQVLSGIAFCHTHGVVHRDLKPGNVMLTNSYFRKAEPVYFTGSCYPFVRECIEENSNFDCKIIDFGLAKTFDPTDPNGGITDVNGTPAYMAPEICMRQGTYGAPSDVWSVGIMSYELFTGNLPFGDASDYEGGFRDLFEITKKYQDMESFWSLMPEEHWKVARRRWTNCGTGPRDFVAHLLVRDPQTRFSAEKALQHPWLESYKPLRDGLTSAILQSIKDFAEATHFVKICLLLIAARLNAETLEPFRHAFIGVDTEGNGSLSIDEFFEAVENLDNRKLCCDHSRWEMSYWFEQIDLNKDGRLDYSEFLAACLHSELHRYDDDGRGKALASHAFQVIDADGDGLATLGDLKHFFHGDAKTLELGGLPTAEFDVSTFYACLMGEDLSSSSSSESEDAQCTARRVKPGDEVNCMLAVRKLVKERRHLDVKIACKVNTGSQQIHYFRWM